MNSANQQKSESRHGVLSRSLGAAQRLAALEPAHQAGAPNAPTGRLKIVGLLAAAAIFLAVAGPLLAQQAPVAAASTAQPSSAPANRLRLVMAVSRASSAPKAPDFSLKANDGQTYTLDGLKGNVVLLFFWATWCPYCRRAVPHMVELSSEYANSSFTMIGISGDKNSDAWWTYIEEHQMQWPQYLDQGHRIAHLFHASGVPNFFLIDQNGAMVFHQTGWGDSTADRLKQLIDRTLAGSGQQESEKRPLVYTGAPAH
jgi:peroxiredoxin